MLMEERYERKLTYGQGKGLKSLIYFLQKLDVKLKIKGIHIHLREHGQPGEPSRYSVNFRYYDVIE